MNSVLSSETTIIRRIQFNFITTFYLEKDWFAKYNKFMLSDYKKQPLISTFLLPKSLEDSNQKVFFRRFKSTGVFRRRVHRIVS